MPRAVQTRAFGPPIAHPRVNLFKENPRVVAQIHKAIARAESHQVAKNGAEKLTGA